MERIEDKSSSPFSTYVQELNALIKEGDLERATSLLEDIPTEWRDRRQVLVPAAIVQSQNGNCAEALISIKAARQAGAHNPRIFKLQARILKNLGDVAAYAETLNTLIENFPGNTFALSQLSLHYFSLNRIDEARTCAAALPDTEQWQAFRLSLEYRLAIARADLDAISVVLNRILTESPVLPALPNLRATLEELPEADREDIFERISRKWPDMKGALKARRISLAMKQPEHDRIEQAMTLALGGQILEAQRLLSGLSATTKMDSELIGMLECLPSGDTLRRLAIVDSGDDVVLSPKGNNGTTLLVFTGLADKAMVPIELVDRFCAAEGHSSIYLRDAGRSAYIAGVPALSGDFEGTLVALAALLEQYETQKLLCLGTSLGGFAAIRYGIRLKAERVMGASAPTNITSDFIANIGDDRGQLVARRLQRSFTAGQLDLRPEVAAENGRCKIDLWFGDKYPIDANHASYLSGCAGVNQFPIIGFDRHDSFLSIATSGGFQEFLRS
jgi:tetratricopeptide (TPR) repeat protein